MKTLIAEDDFTSSVILQELLRGYGPFHLASNGKDAVAAVAAALAAHEPYDLVCLDIMMPEMDGQEALLSHPLISQRKSQRKSRRSIRVDEGAIQTRPSAFSRGRRASWAERDTSIVPD